MLYVICLEGCHGCGKTRLSDQFEEVGFQVLDEAFLDMPAYALHPQSLLMETKWVCSWFERILKKSKELEEAMDASPKVYIADRSPYSAVFYASKGKLLEPVIREQMAEVNREANVRIVTVHLQVSRGILWNRIQQRLLDEPDRVKYSEDKIEWMDQVMNFYDNFQWDFRVNNDNNLGYSLHSLMLKLLASIARKDHDFTSAILASNKGLADEVAEAVQDTDPLSPISVPSAASDVVSRRVDAMSPVFSPPPLNESSMNPEMDVAQKKAIARNPEWDKRHLKVALDDVASLARHMSVSEEI